MCERISGIQIEGGYFNTLCTLSPFHTKSTQGKPIHISIIYGKNGSGKTSLAQGFYEIANGNSTFIKTVLLDHDGNPVNDIAKDRIFIFDENYIRRVIKFTEDGLDSVVMLGEQVDLDNKIKELESKASVLNKEIESDKLAFNTNYKADNSPLSPQYHWNAIRENLHQNWSIRESKIKGLRQNAPVRDDFISSLFQNDECLVLEDIRKKFENTLSQLKSASSGERVDQVLTKIDIDKNFELNMISLLEKVIQEPVLSNRERIIMHIIKKSPGSEKFLMQATNIFSDPNIDRCPLCLQVVDESYKNALVDSISKVFDTDEAMKHREELTSIVLKNFQIDLRPFNKIDSSLCDKLQSYINKYNSVIDIIKKDISQKLNSIYFPLTSRSYDLCNLQMDINKCIDNLEKSRVIYNKNIDSIADIKTNLIKINKNYAREEVRHFYQQYQHQLSEYKSKEMQISAKEAELKELQVSINRLNAQKENINIAIELINDYLMYIFFEKSRLQLEVNKGKYIVKCRGQHVKLASLSVGERNVIALCYFLSVLFHRKQRQDIYKEKCLIVLDDPISSFDFDNKIGIYSFMRYIFNSVYENNKSSRFLILTHEIEAMFNLIHVCSDIKLNYKAYELKNKTLIPFNDRAYNEYSILIRRIFSYAAQEIGYTDYNDSIGNTMRKVLEAYGTFVYKKGIEELSCNKDILAIIKDERKRIYFNNLMYRLVLHGESHLQERAKGIPDTDFFSHVSESEKIRTAKEILIFINLLNPLHLREHLRRNQSDDGAAILNKIKAWENELFEI